MPTLPWIAFIGMLLALPGLALARDDGRWAGSPYNVWYGAQHNANGEFCCSEADAEAFYGTYTLTADGGVEFDADGTHHQLPAFMVLHGPNPTGHAVWWHTTRRSYCFAIGSGG